MINTRRASSGPKPKTLSSYTLQVETARRSNQRSTKRDSQEMRLSLGGELELFGMTGDKITDSYSHE